MWFLPTKRAGAVAAALFFAASQLHAQSPEGRLTADAAGYFDLVSGVSSVDLVRRALRSNRELAAAQLLITRARARLVQARLFPNPSLDLQQARGTGESTDSDISLGIAMPIELGGKRSSRIAITEAELRAAEAEFNDRRRRSIADVMNAYIDALAALRELDVIARLNDLDVETGKYVQARVSEGDASPLEMNLLRVEIERLRARRILLRGNVDAAMMRLRNLVGMPLDEALRFRQDFSASKNRGEPPATVDEAVQIALSRRPDLQLARFNEMAAEANVRAARAQAFPDITAFTKYDKSKSNIESSPVGFIADPDRHLGFGVSISLPFFNRAQGLRAEAGAAVEQARHQREFIESVIRTDVASAHRRVTAADQATSTYQTGVIDASTENFGVIQAAYKLGEFRITDLIAERRRLTDSQREFTELLAERQRALADLNTAMGVFAPEETR